VLWSVLLGIDAVFPAGLTWAAARGVRPILQLG